VRRRGFAAAPGKLFCASKMIESGVQKEVQMKVSPDDNYETLLAEICQIYENTLFHVSQQPVLKQICWTGAGT
jgi:hypothetical protein